MLLRDDAARSRARGEAVHVDRVAGAGDRAGTERQLVGLGEHRREPADDRGAARRRARGRSARRAPAARGAGACTTASAHRPRASAWSASTAATRRDRAAGSRGPGASGRGGDRPRPARCATVPCAGAARRRRSARRARARRTSARPRRRARRRREERRIVAALRSDLAASAARIADASAARQHAGAREPCGPRQAAAHVVFEQPAIEPERRAEREQLRRRDRRRTVRTRGAPCSVTHRFRPGGRLARRGLDRQSPDLDEPFRGAVVVEIAGVVSRQVVLVQAEG